MSAVIQLAERAIVLNFGKVHRRRARPTSSCGTRRSSTRISGGRALLEVAGLAAGYLGERVIDGIDVEVRTGEAVAIVGSNGAGKTTLFRAIAGLLPAMEGRVVLDGKDLARRPAHRISRAGIAYVPAERHLFPAMTLKTQPRPGRVSQAAGPARRSSSSTTSSRG